MGKWKEREGEKWEKSEEKGKKNREKNPSKIKRARGTIVNEQCANVWFFFFSFNPRSKIIQTHSRQARSHTAPRESGPNGSDMPLDCSWDESSCRSPRKCSCAAGQGRSKTAMFECVNVWAIKKRVGDFKRAGRLKQKAKGKYNKNNNKRTETKQKRQKDVNSSEEKSSTLTLFKRLIDAVFRAEIIEVRPW